MTEQEALQALKKQTEAYVGQVFDHVSSLGHTGLLGQLYGFQIAIEEKITELAAREKACEAEKNTPFEGWTHDSGEGFVRN